MSRKKTISKVFLVIGMAMTLMLVSCEPQVVLFPLYTDKDLVTDGRLVGTWADQDGHTYTCEQDSVLRVLAFYQGDRVKLQSDVHLVRLGGYLFVDFMAKHDRSEEERAQVLMIPYPVLPVHTFGRIQIDPAGAYVRMALLDKDWVWDQNKEDTLGLDVLTPEYENLVVSPTEKLQKFALQHAEDKKAFSFELALCRQGHDCKNLGQ